MEQIPNEDIRIAEENGLCLVIRRKTKQGAKWILVKEVESNLRSAILQALRIEDFEVGVLVKTTTGERIYWTSKIPNLFNSPVLSQIGVIRRRCLKPAEGDFTP